MLPFARRPAAPDAATQNPTAVRSAMHLSTPHSGQTAGSTEDGSTAVGRLVQQAAPPRVVLEACELMPEWHSVEGQAVLLQALALDPDSAAVDPSYRQRLLKAVVAALQKLGVELHEQLLETYLEGLSLGGGPAPESPESSRWSVQTYEVERGQRLRLRVHKGIGGGTETGGVVWPAALVLCAWLMRLPSLDDLEVHLALALTLTFTPT